MKVSVTTEQDLSIESLAIALAKSTPDEFAEFWLQFSRRVNTRELEAFAQAMAPTQGGARKVPLVKLCRLMEYHEIQRDFK